MDWLSGPASIVSSLIGGLFGNHQQKKANEANIQMVRETNQANIEQQQLANASNQLIAKNANELQLQMMRDAQRWNQEQITAERAYNSPLQQVHRLLQAGINPSSASADTQAGFPSSPMGTVQVGAPMQAAQLQAPQVQPINSLSQSMTQIANVLSALQTTNIFAGASRYGADVAASASRYASDTSSKVIREGQAISKELQEKQLQIDSNKADAEIALSRSLTEQANAQVGKIQSETVAQDIINSNLPARLAAETKATTEQARASIINANAFMKNVVNQYELGKKQSTLNKAEFLQSVREQARRFLLDMHHINVSTSVSERALQLSIDQWNKQFEGLGELWNFLGIKGSDVANGAALRYILK